MIVRRTALLGAALTVVALAVYAYVVLSQGVNDGTLRVPFVVAFLVACAVGAALGAAVPLRSLRTLLLSFSAAGLLVLGLLAIFSVGLIFLLAAVPIAVAAIQSAVVPFPRLVAVLLGVMAALATLGAGFWLTGGG